VLVLGARALLAGGQRVGEASAAGARRGVPRRGAARGRSAGAWAGWCPAAAGHREGLDRGEAAGSRGRALDRRATVQRDEQVRAADDAILGALFREAEQIRLAHEAPYNLERELELFTEWLDSKR
jgi:hypothetical protein